MKIISQNYSTTKIYAGTYGIQAKNNIHKTNLTFQGGLETTAQNVLKDPKTMELFSKYVTRCFLEMQELANSSSKNNIAEVIGKICAKLKSQENEISELKEQIKALKEKPIDAEPAVNTERPPQTVQITENELFDDPQSKSFINIKQVGFMEINDKTDPKNAQRQKILEQNAEKTVDTTEKQKNTIKDLNNKIFFKKEGTVNNNLFDNMNSILIFFEDTLWRNYKEEVKTNPDAEAPRWKWNIKTPIKIKRAHITSEIEYQNSQTNYAYKNIIEEDISELATIINKESRFHELFDIHSTLRLLDRYVKFNIDESIESQITKIINKLSDLIQKECENGTLIEKYEKDGYCSPCIIINAENFDEEAREIFGTKNLVIGLSENKDYAGRYIPKYNRDKTAIISTIYSAAM